MSTPLAQESWVNRSIVVQRLGANAPDDADTLGQEVLDDCIKASAELLYSLSGRQFPGLVSAVVRPTSRPEQVPDQPYGRWLFKGGWAYGWADAWMWGTCAACGFTGCCGPYMIGLGRSPITDITNIQINGDVLDPTEYRVDDGKWLVREGCAGWPTCQDLSRPLGEDCTFGVSFTWGQDPPQAGINAATLLAAEFYAASTPGMTCKLPQRITSITRQGVSFTVIDPQSFLEKGLTGLYSVDLFIKAYNPAGQIRKPTVWSPDFVNQARRQTWPTT